MCETLKQEDIISIHFQSIDQKVDIDIPCLMTDTFVRIEEILYDKYPEYKDKETYFLASGEKVKRFKSIQENKIKNFDEILFDLY